MSPVSPVPRALWEHKELRKGLRGNEDGIEALRDIKVKFRFQEQSVCHGAELHCIINTQTLSAPAPSLISYAYPVQSDTRLSLNYKP
jgi:hypothetical protein